jgi:hypothetical protein
VTSASERHGSTFARYRTSRASTKPSISGASVSMAGTATSVRCSGGMPLEKSRRGRIVGRTRRVAAHWTTATASWLLATASNSASAATSDERMSASGVADRADTVSAAVKRTMAARKIPRRERRTRRAQPVSRPTARSSSVRPSPTRK